MRDELSPLPESVMLICHDQMRFLQWMVELLRPQRILEVGTFFGYSALAMAQALPENGHIDTIDKEAVWSAQARTYWERAGVDHKITTHIGMGHEVLENLPNPINAYDMIFIDADKQRSDIYYEYGLKYVRPGGLIIVDNALWKGKVADPENIQATTQYMRDLNRKIADDPRVRPYMMPLGDGMFMAIKL